MANKRIQDLEQTTDLTNDDLLALDTTRKTFATTLKSLTDWLKGTFQTTANLEQTLSDATDKYPCSKVVKDESSRIMSIMDNILSTLYPVGSIYIGTQATCPLAALIQGSAWEIIGNNVVTDLSNEVWINGTGMGLMFTDNSSNSYQQVGDVYNSWGVKVSNTDYFSNPQRAGSGVNLGQYQTALNGALGVCLNGGISGLIGYLKSASTGNGTHVWKRTA